MAQTEQHTPGPWEFAKERRWLFRDNLKVDGVFSSTTILKIDDDAFRPSDADARLIVAAPELLEAAMYAVQQLAEGEEPDFDADGEEIDPFERLRAAIAKATGSSS